MKELTAAEIIERQGQMEQERRPFEDMRDYCVRMALPARENMRSYWSYSDNGEIKGKNIWDGATSANIETRANGIMAWFMPKGRDWFTPLMSDSRARESKVFRQWLQEVREQLKFAVSRSNYYEMKRIKVMDADVVGSNFMFIDEEVRSKKTYCICPHPRECWRGQDYWGITNEIHYRFEKTLRQIKDEFGDEALSPAQKAALEKTPDQKVKIIQRIWLNYDYDTDKSPAGKNKKWRTVWVNCENSGVKGAGKIIREGGYNTMNPIDWELNKSPHELYGRGTVSQFLIEVLTTNKLMKALLLRGAQSAEPPMIALDILKPSLNLKPAGVTWLDAATFRGMGTSNVMGAIGEVLQKTNADFAYEMLERFHVLLESRLGVQFFRAMQLLGESGGEYKNQMLVQQIQAERAALMSPFLNTHSLQTDLELDRFYDIEYSAGRMPEPPQEIMAIKDASIDIEYTGPIVQILKQFYEKSSLYGSIQDLAQTMALDPSQSMNVDLDMITQLLMQNNNLTEKAIIPIDEVKRMRQVIAQQQEAQQNAAMAQQLAPALREARGKIDEGSLIDSLKKVA